ncbi:transposase, partial [Leptospira santarosai]|nr:transposase [Leptospira santarosai]
MNLALQIPNFEPPKQSDKANPSWSEICIFNPWKGNRTQFPTLPSNIKSTAKMKIPSDLSFSTANFSAP